MERFVRESFDIEDSKYCYYYWYTGLPARPASQTLNRLTDLWAESQRDGRIFASGIYFDCTRVGLPERNNTEKRGAGLSPGLSPPLLCLLEIYI